jgi:hypothetical protein
MISRHVYRPRTMVLSVVDIEPEWCYFGIPSVHGEVRLGNNLLGRGLSRRASCGHAHYAHGFFPTHHCSLSARVLSLCPGVPHHPSNSRPQRVRSLPSPVFWTTDLPRESARHCHLFARQEPLTLLPGIPGPCHPFQFGLCQQPSGLAPVRRGGASADAPGRATLPK